MRNAYVVVSLALAGMAACGDNLQGNRSPSASDSNVNTPEDTPVSITVNASDPDPDDGLIVSFSRQTCFMPPAPRARTRRYFPIDSPGCTPNCALRSGI